jgi:hypothetical protein
MGGTIIRIPFKLRRAKNGRNGPRVNGGEKKAPRPDYRCLCGQKRKTNKALCGRCERGEG